MLRWLGRKIKHLIIILFVASLVWYGIVQLTGTTKPTFNDVKTAAQQTATNVITESPKKIQDDRTEANAAENNKLVEQGLTIAKSTTASDGEPKFAGKNCGDAVPGQEVLNVWQTKKDWLGCFNYARPQVGQKYTLSEGDGVVVFESDHDGQTLVGQVVDGKRVWDSYEQTHDAVIAANTLGALNTKTHDVVDDEYKNASATYLFEGGRVTVVKDINMTIIHWIAVYDGGWEVFDKEE